VAFWVPDALPPVGKPFEAEYKLHWYLEGKAGAVHPPAGYVDSTREGTSKTHEPEVRRFWINFDGSYLRTHPADSAVQAVVTVGKGAKLVNQSLEKNPYNGTWRVALAVLPDGSGQPVELRCFLKREPHILTETWSYLWNP
jgi:glucans biosynthesis protein